MNPLFLLSVSLCELWFAELGQPIGKVTTIDVIFKKQTECNWTQHTERDGEKQEEGREKRKAGNPARVTLGSEADEGTETNRMEDRDETKSREKKKKNGKKRTIH